MDHPTSTSGPLTNLSAGCVSRLKSIAQTRTLEAGETLFVQGDMGKSLFILDQGSVEISTVNLAGKKLTLNIMRPPDAFGEIAALDGGVRTATAVALEATRLFQVDRVDISRIVLDHPDIAHEFILVLCGRLRWTSQQVEDLGLQDIERRLAHRLLILDEKFSGGNGRIDLSQSEIADFLGATRESVNKTFTAWTDQGIIRVARGSVHIQSHQALEDIGMNVP